MYLNQMPFLLYQTCRAIYKTVRRIYPSSTSQALNSFFFFRFFIPALVSPVKFGIVQKELLNPTAQKNLVLISKIIQHIATNSEVESGPLACLNDFIMLSSRRVLYVYQELWTFQEDSFKSQQSLSVSNQEILDSLVYIKGYIQRNINDIHDLLVYSDFSKVLLPFVLDFVENLIEDKTN
eukprot:Anaeramoba_ignava/a93606_20.p1 GENE.a93606_20~~a93606_20.p1  ORF type:complete len:180 (-),score=58.07 a93606_20:161-700(-)